MKFFKIGAISLAVVMWSCGAEPEKGEVISMEDFAGETGVIEEDTASTEIKDTLILEGELNQFINEQLVDFDTALQTKFHPVDRFSFNQQVKIEFKSKTEVEYGRDQLVTPLANFYYYTFSDTTKTKNALYNWLDCFGGECAQVKLNEDFDALKMPPEFVLVYDTLILVADYRCEDAKFDWGPFQKAMIGKFGKNYRHQFKVGCGGPLTWK